MHDGMQYDLTKVKVEVTGLLRFQKLHFSRSISAIYNGSWQMTTDS